MRRIPLLLVALGLLASPSLAGAAGQQAQPVAPAGGPSVDEAIKTVRADLQGTRADIMAKNLTLSSEQAAKFWPLFDQYQKEQNVIIEEQLKGLHQYATSYDTLDDAAALALMKAHFDRDARMNTLRQKWLAEFQKVLPAKLAVRAMQIDRRLSLMAQVELSTQIPLVH